MTEFTESEAGWIQRSDARVLLRDLRVVREATPWLVVIARRRLP